MHNSIKAAKPQNPIFNPHISKANPIPHKTTSLLTFLPAQAHNPIPITTASKTNPNFMARFLHHPNPPPLQDPNPPPPPNSRIRAVTGGGTTLRFEATASAVSKINLLAFRFRNDSRLIFLAHTMKFRVWVGEELSGGSPTIVKMGFLRDVCIPERL